jgi:hypothetical protein
MFEHHKQPVLPVHHFYYRMGKHFAWGAALILCALMIGIAGYHFIEGLAWIDAFMEASMILSGMGPSVQIKSNAGKIFAGCYALFSGLVFISVIGIVAAPILHRFFHEFHLEKDSKK